MSITITKILKELNVPEQVLTDRKVFIQTARFGLPSLSVKIGCKLLSHEFFTRLLEADSYEIYSNGFQEKLNRRNSEKVLDVLFTLSKAEDV
jgi:hypothetical protein